MKITIRHTELPALIKKLERIKSVITENGNEFFYDIEDTRIQEIQYGTNFNLTNGYSWKTVKVLVDDVEIYGLIENNDWKVVGLAERQHNGEVVINTLDKTTEIPQSFYGSEIRCDHCHTNRRRDQGVIILNKETGEFKMVGNACLTEYTGISIETLKSLFGLKEEMTDGSGKKKKLVSTNYTIDKYIYNVEEVLCVAKALLHFFETQENKRLTNNWSAQSAYIKRYTVYGIYALHCPTKDTGVNKSDYSEGSRYMKYYLNSDPISYLEEVKKMISWIASFDENSIEEWDTIHGKAVTKEMVRNMAVYARQDYLKLEGAKDIVDLVYLYDYYVVNAEAREAEKERRAKEALEALRKATEKAEREERVESLFKVGEEVKFTPVEYKCMTPAWNKNLTAILAKDANGEVYMWYQGTRNVPTGVEMTGTVKEFEEKKYGFSLDAENVYAIRLEKVGLAEKDTEEYAINENISFKVASYTFSEPKRGSYGKYVIFNAMTKDGKKYVSFLTEDAGKKFQSLLASNPNTEFTGKFKSVNRFKGEEQIVLTRLSA